MEKLIQYRTRESLYEGPFDAKAGWAAAGMGYIAVTENGKLIVVDGGHSNDAEDFVSLLVAYSSGKKPEIDLWIITHPILIIMVPYRQSVERRSWQNAYM